MGEPTRRETVSPLIYKIKFINQRATARGTRNNYLQVQAEGWHQINIKSTKFYNETN